MLHYIIPVFTYKLTLNRVGNLILRARLAIGQCNKKFTMCTPQRRFETCLGEWESANFYPLKQSCDQSEYSLYDQDVMIVSVSIKVWYQHERKIGRRRKTVET